MKEITKMSRLVNQLERMFKAINTDFFDDKLEVPIITVTPSSNSYAHYTPWNAWNSADSGKREINIASGTLNRPLVAIAASLVHEMVHMLNDTVLNVQDCSRNNTYHNKYFKQTAESHGLRVSKTEKYGYSHTEPSDELILWLMDHDEFREIEMCRVDSDFSTLIGIHTGYGVIDTSKTSIVRSNSRRYICPSCRSIVRATKSVNIICGDCHLKMIES